MDRYSLEISVMSGAGLEEREIKTPHVIALSVETQGSWVIALAMCPLCESKKDGKSTKRVIAAREALEKLSAHIKYDHQRTVDDFVFSHSWKPQIARLTEQLEAIIK